MVSIDYKARDGSDPRLAAHAAGPLPAWLWSTDGARVLWANRAGAGFFGGDAELAGKSFGPADPHRRQVAQLAGRLPENGAVRLERLRGFGAAPGTLATCACARLEFADGGAGTLVVAMLSPAELQRLARTARTAADERGGSAPAGYPAPEPLPESPVHAEIGPAH